MIPDDNNPSLPESLLDPPAPSAAGLPSPEMRAAATTSPLLIQPEALPPMFQQFPEDLRVPWSWPDQLLLIAVTLLGTFV
ncbi:MAG: hypothetical protein WB723_21960, partial [Candidatus Acidiferrales bacterium]